MMPTGLLLAIMGAVACALATASCARRDGTLLTASLAGALAAAAALAVGLARPQMGIALGSGAASFAILRGKGNWPSDITGFVLSLIAGWSSPAIALAHLALTLWTRERISRTDGVILLASVLIAISPLDAQWPARLGAIVALGVTALAMRRHTSHQIAGPGGRKVLSTLAASLPLLALLALLALDGPALHLAPDDSIVAWSAASGAIILGGALILMVVGIATVLSTRNEIRAMIAGAAATAILGAALLGSDAALVAILPLSLAGGVGAHVLAPITWRAGLRMRARRSP